MWPDLVLHPGFTRVAIGFALGFAIYAVVSTYLKLRIIQLLEGED